jgi:hypothetical protein
MNIHVWIILFAFFSSSLMWSGLCYKRDEKGKVRFNYDKLKQWWWLPIAMFLIFELGYCSGIM